MLRTGDGIGEACSLNVLGKNNSKTLGKVEFNVAVEEPGSGVVGGEANGNPIGGAANVDDVTNRGIVVVVDGRPRATNDGERVLGWRN